MKRRYLLLLSMMVLWLAGCGDATDSAATSVQQRETTILREVDFAQVSRGARLFAMNCAECHGANAQGADNWRQRDADGMLPPPPLNGTGHAWHHPRRMLHYVIKHGSPGGQGKMPAWQGRLSDEEIEAIIAWFQSKWPDQVYASWYQMDQRSQSGS